MQQTNRQYLRERLLQNSLKATHQRIVVYEALTELHGHHPTAEEVYQHLKPANPSISLGTVYKTLDTFVEAELIRRVLSEEGGKRYDANTMVHNHIYCSNTKEIIDYEDAELEQLLQDFFRKRNLENFEIKSFSVQLTGKKVVPEKQISISRVSK
ncbi:Fur family peroxide stress response transcriptional regulator [Pontibacter ummariensis]|uniref:Fur family transcriptional regulator, peroxide stress response regulator n=1 Tax=Pontibacter ummariensis TaxID=1610492 RepID=A0A239EAV6_9BACT|nr:transcriptional repressor [Pontibacter ummariensis]PRY13162.1 Fur family peroxide stress response transcriptional regulator [Pontibacter ummariensis]SNS41629.1 Fur family transcriptional regulator, peroxide stress response regulator [Pontibacter ummariensis]